jgi:hypothetical protein
MTDRRDGNRAASATSSGPAGIQQRLAALAEMPSPALPPGPCKILGNRVMVYLRPEKAGAVLPHVDARRGGIIVAGAKSIQTLRALKSAGARFPMMADPACYERVTATCDAPFSLLVDGVVPPTLADALDQQIRAGAVAALAPTGYIPAGGTHVLKAAARQFRQLGRADSIFVAPLDVSLLDRAYFRQTAAILADLGSPVAIILGGQGDPLDQASRIIPNLRLLAAWVPLIPIRTDFNALDLVAHGAIAAAIGTGGRIRHTIDPAEKPKSFKPGPSPSVLWPELVSWQKGSTISEFFGARPTRAPRCDCRVCGGQRITRFLRREHQEEAIAHAVAVWSRWAGDLLDAPTLQQRAEYWKNLCTGAVQHHDVFLKMMNRLDGLKPQKSLKLWAKLPAWPVPAGAPVP